MFTPANDVEVVKKLECGLYDVSRDTYGNYHCLRKEVNTTEILKLPEPGTVEVIDQIKMFYAKKELFKKWNFNHKRGILLHGTPGGGKTCLISSIMDYVCNEIRGVAFYIPSADKFSIYRDFINTVFRELEPDTPIIIIIEDIDAYFGNNGYGSTETTLLNTIDGVENKNNVLYLATTNYPENLPPRIYNRPGRFDLKIEIKPPCDESRDFYFRNRIPEDIINKIDVTKWVKDTDGMTIAQLSELVKAHFILEQDYDTILEALRNKTIPSSGKYAKEAVGFKHTTLSGIKA
jgi:SpoVK/Ycf46/Vps4 family AAA+-type ATPase